MTSPLIIKSITPLALIAFAQCLGTSLWFAGNAVISKLNIGYANAELALAGITNGTQLGFILGTLFLSVWGAADKYLPHRIFAISASLGAILNLTMALTNDIYLLVFIRVSIGFCLAGIYPIGMKLAVLWNPGQASKALSWLVAMLVIGTASPHATTTLLAQTPIIWVLVFISICAFSAGTIILMLGTPTEQVSKPTQKINGFTAFRYPEFRRAAYGYFGHMWELYAFWALVPYLLSFYDFSQINFWSFLVISVGALGCIIGGLLSQGKNKLQTPNGIATLSLLISATCCLTFALSQTIAPSNWMVICILIVWGATVVSDSPQLSAMASLALPKQVLASGLSIQNCIGFAISMISIDLCLRLWDIWEAWVVLLLLPGPIAGLWSLNRKKF